MSGKYQIHNTRPEHLQRIKLFLPRDDRITKALFEDIVYRHDIDAVSALLDILTEYDAWLNQSETTNRPTKYNRESLAWMTSWLVDVCHDGDHPPPGSRATERPA